MTLHAPPPPFNLLDLFVRNPPDFADVFDYMEWVHGLLVASVDLGNRDAAGARFLFAWAEDLILGWCQDIDDGPGYSASDFATQKEFLYWVRSLLSASCDEAVMGREESARSISFQLYGLVWDFCT